MIQPKSDWEWSKGNKIWWKAEHSSGGSYKCIKLPSIPRVLPTRWSCSAAMVQTQCVPPRPPVSSLVAAGRCEDQGPPGGTIWGEGRCTPGLAPPLATSLTLQLVSLSSNSALLHSYTELILEFTAVDASLTSFLLSSSTEQLYFSKVSYLNEAFYQTSFQLWFCWSLHHNFCTMTLLLNWASKYHWETNVNAVFNPKGKYQV